MKGYKFINAFVKGDVKMDCIDKLEEKVKSLSGVISQLTKAVYNSYNEILTLKDRVEKLENKKCGCSHLKKALSPCVKCEE